MATPPKPTAPETNDAPVAARSSRVACALLVVVSVAALAPRADGSGDEEKVLCPDTHAPIATSAAGVDVEVDFSQPETVSTLTGVLHGITSETPYSAIADMPLAAARGRGVFMDVFALHGITPVLVVSDRVGLGGESPAADWSAYEDQVRNLAVEYGTSVIYDIWNEPDQPFFWPFWSGMSAEEDEKSAEFFEAFARAHDAIREVLGDTAVISGPSFGGIDEPLLQKFMDFCLHEGLTVQVLSVHLIYDPDHTFGDVESELNRLYQDYIAGPVYAAVGVAELHVNEYGAPKQYGRPGSMLALMRVMERAGVSQAMRASWGRAEAFTGDLNGYLVFAGIAEPLVEVEPNPGAMSDLLTPELRPRPIWWAYKLYAEGAGSRVAADSQLDFIMPLASRASEALAHDQLLLAGNDSGNHPERPDTIGVRLNDVPEAGMATLRLSRIPYDDSIELDEPVVVYECELGPDAGDPLTLSIEMPEDYEVLALTIETVPEPSTAALGAAALGSLAWLGRWRRPTRRRSA